MGAIKFNSPKHYLYLNATRTYTCRNPSQMKHLSTFRIFQDPVEAEELIEVLQKYNIPFERSFEKRDDSEDYLGSNPFDANIIFKIKQEDFTRVEAFIKEDSIKR